MLIDEGMRRELGREAVRFCRRCPALEERSQGGEVVYACGVAQCRLWVFLTLLGLRPGSDFTGPTAEETLGQAHAREVRRFRGLLPIISPDHDWDADARFHGLACDRPRLYHDCHPDEEDSRSPS